MKYAEELKNKKQAIYVALLNYLSPDKAANAIAIWGNEFSDKPAFELQSFITRVTSEFNVDINRKDLHQSIIKLLLNNSSIPQRDDYLVESMSLDTAKNTLQPAHTIFALLITQWLDEIYSINRSLEFNVKQYIFSNLEKLPISFDEILNIKRWFNSNDQPSYIKALTEEHMKKIFHFCYIGSCEYIGPVKTDKIVSDIVKSIEDTPEAIYFSPKNFF